MSPLLPMKQSLRDRILDLIGIRDGIVFVEAQKLAKFLNAANIAVDDGRLDGVFPF